MSLFQLGPFTLPSGATSYFKIECDELTPDDWASLARLAADILMPFSRVEGVPRGGVPFADALRPYTKTEGGLLIADDVWVSGLSMERYRDNRPAFGVVAFARGDVPEWVTVLFHMDTLAEKATYHDLTL
jgi:hypothetical protein